MTAFIPGPFPLAAPVLNQHPAIATRRPATECHFPLDRPLLRQQRSDRAPNRLRTRNPLPLTKLTQRRQLLVR